MVFTSGCLAGDGQPLAALSTTTGENLATTLGGHAGAEAMALCALPLVGLVRALHIESSWNNSRG